MDVAVVEKQRLPFSQDGGVPTLEATFAFGFAQLETGCGYGASSVLKRGSKDFAPERCEVS